MPTYVILPEPSANRVYAQQAAAMTAAEVSIMAGELSSVETVVLGGVEHVRIGSDAQPEALSRLSSVQMAYEEIDGLLRPLDLDRERLLADDLISIPKYQGKTNEQFTQLMINCAIAALERDSGGQLDILDPMCGRGTTLSCAWRLGHNGFGVEADVKAVEAHAGFLKTYLRRKRLKHTATMNPVRRDGKSLGKRFDASVNLPGHDQLNLGIITGDTRQSAALWGRRKFDLVVTDAPYGVVHGSQTDVRGVSGRRDRSPAGLLGEAVPVWVGQLRAGGVLAVAWNTYGFAREDFVALLTGHGLQVHDDGPWRRLAHRVDSSINRDLIVATRPT
ncbi:TRM11 family SAM-dependent methyltransferase [Propionibacteriaceae bacterium Y1685]|uniref:TRM11 family SAM-dependent methyltransferase n=1 Tax=Microlunatus sp. Y1700 TaxID=3418487 RepID=UPI003B802ABB